MAFTYRAKGSIIFKILLNFKAAVEIGCVPGQQIQPEISRPAKESFFSTVVSGSRVYSRPAGWRPDADRLTPN